MPVPKATWRNLAPTLLAFGEKGGVFFQYLEAFPPMMLVKVVPQAVPGLQGHWTASKGAWALIRALLKTDVKDLRNVFRLNDRKPVQVIFWLHPIHMPSIFCS